ncbi:MAG TPA: thiamine pyrophosphate-dependent enzyme, partial [Candidatus Binatia bacterium]|nr:thiamine pyrophosphate-dependent enzyme [Candidatus Binatia bacterium]
SSHFGEVRLGVEQELSEWEMRDPLKRMADLLIGNGLASADDLQRLRQEEEQRIEDTFKQVAAEVR